MSAISRYVILFIFSVSIGSSWAQTPNSPIQIASIEISGNQKTKRDIILRELAFALDSSYNRGELLEKYIPLTKWNLKNLNLFNKIEISQVEDGNGSIKIQITVVEKWYLWPIPFVEFADRNFNQWYELDLDLYRTNYGLYLFRYNAFGRNHTAKLSLINGYNREVGVQYMIPWFAGKPNIGFDVKARYRRNREVWYATQDNKLLFYRDLDKNLLKRFNSEVRLNIRPKLYATHQPYIQYHRLNADTIVDYQLNSSFFRFRRSMREEIRIGYQFNYQRTNNRFFPTKGNFLQLRLQHLWFFTGDQYPSISLESGHIKNLGKGNWSYALGLKAGKKFDQFMPRSFLPYEHRRMIGYENQLRGYEAYVIDGNTFATLSSELRFHFISERHFNLKYMPVKNYRDMPNETYISLFVDQGYVRNIWESTSLNQTYLIGYGVGLNAMFYYDKVFRFEYSFNKRGEHGFRLHFKKSV